MLRPELIDEQRKHKHTHMRIGKTKERKKVRNEDVKRREEENSLGTHAEFSGFACCVNTNDLQSETHLHSHATDVDKSTCDHQDLAWDIKPGGFTPVITMSTNEPINFNVKVWTGPVRPTTTSDWTQTLDSSTLLSCTTCLEKLKRLSQERADLRFTSSSY